MKPSEPITVLIDALAGMGATAPNATDAIRQLLASPAALSDETIIALLTGPAADAISRLTEASMRFTSLALATADLACRLEQCRRAILARGAGGEKTPVHLN